MTALVFEVLPMKLLAQRAWRAVGLFAMLSLSGLPALAQSNRATFPANVNEFKVYSVQERGSSRTEALALPETIRFAKVGQPLPPGTRILLGIWENNTLTGYFVMEKGQDWGLDFSAEERTGDWHFQEYNTKGQISRRPIAERCQSCHQGAAKTDFIFTFNRMLD
jgi:hypothetical protein